VALLDLGEPFVDAGEARVLLARGHRAVDRGAVDLVLPVPPVALDVGPVPHAPTMPRTVSTLAVNQG
jgi:hypothetical protein